ncbi:MAG: hypothetical protein AB7O59_06105 [Pirellulales bacterium]
MNPPTSATFQSLRLEEAKLDAERLRLYAEIRNYPTPIAGCDQQFNYLLEQQARVNGELARVRAALAAAAE